MKVRRELIVKHPVSVARQGQPPVDVRTMIWDELQTRILTYFYEKEQISHVISRPDNVYFKIQNVAVNRDHSTTFSVDLHHPEDLYRNRPKYLAYASALLEHRLRDAFDK